jgi:hypothetical protein
MAIAHLSDKPKGITFIVWDGKVIWDDWLQHVQDLIADPHWLSTQRFIADMQSVTDASAIQGKDFERAALVLAENRAALNMKTGAVVASAEFWQAQRFGKLIEGLGTSTVVFNTLDTACVFLGIDLIETQHTIEQLRSHLRGTGQ